MKLPIMPFSPASYYIIPLVSKYSQTPSVCVLPLGSETKFHTHMKLQAKLVLCILIFEFLDSRREDKRL
jgi:hypothetical protein